MVKNPPSNAGDMDSIHGLGAKIPHAAGQSCVPQLQSPRATTTELACSGARAPQLERSLHAAMTIPCAATKTQRSQINK